MNPVFIGFRHEDKPLTALLAANDKFDVEFYDSHNGD